jgi:hypothetical protein
VSRTDAAGRSAETRERVLEGCDLRTVDEVPALEQVCKRAEELLPQRKVDRSQVDERHALGHRPRASD